jgi:hypothetical protein
MSDLVLRFWAGLIEGEGIDIVGRFEFAGSYADNGTVRLVKYYRSHDVLYQGTYDGEGTIFGEWTIGKYWRGPFALTPERRAIAAGAEIQEIAPGLDGS